MEPTPARNLVMFSRIHEVGLIAANTGLAPVWNASVFARSFSLPVSFAPATASSMPSVRPVAVLAIWALYKPRSIFSSARVVDFAFAPATAL